MNVSKALAGAISLAIVGFFTAGGLVRAGESPVLGTLQWTNGDSLPGQLLGATASQVSWQSPVFSSPIGVELRYVDTIHFPKATPSTAIHDPLRFVTHSGDLLDGRLINLTEQYVVVQSSQLGTVNLRRTELRRFFHRPQPGQATATDTVMSRGPRPHQRDGQETIPFESNGEPNWRTLKQPEAAVKWQTNAAGELTTSSFGAEAFRDLKLPPVAEIDLVLRWRNRPRFRIAFAAPDSARLPREAVRLETWDDELTLRVLTGNGQFKQIHTLPKRSKTIRLRLMWSQRTGKLSVYSRDFELLGTMRTGNGSAVGHTGLFIQNLGTDLTLASLRVGNWFGVEPPEVTDRSSHLLLKQGEAIFGQIRSFARASQSLVVTEQAGAQRKVAMSEVVHVELGERLATRANSPLELTYHSGAVLRGTLQSIDRGVVALKTAYCDRPIRCRLAGALALKVMKAGLAPDDRAEAVLECEGTKLRGTLVPPVSGGAFAWQLVGGAKSVPLSVDRPVHIVRDVSGTDGVFETAELPDVLHIRNGDALPCRIQTIDDSFLHFRTTMANADRIPVDRIKAIHLHPAGELPAFGFGGSGWSVARQDEELVQRTAERVVFRGPATLGHGSLLQADEIQFDLQWNDRLSALMTVSLFASDVERRADPSFLVYYMGRQMYVQARQPQVRGVMRRNMLTNGRATIRLSLSHEQCRVSVNQKEVLSLSIDAQDRTGRGIVLSVQQLHTRPQPGPGPRVAPQSGDLLTISNLQVGRNRVPFGSIRIDEPKKELLLTVPRSEKKDPPTHMLVAQNGDLLRGKLVELSERFARFTSRGREFDFPRRRLSGIVWLPETDDQPLAPANGEPSIHARLASGSTLTLAACQMIGNHVVGRHTLLGECRVPFDAIRELYIGDPTAPVDRSAYADWVLRPAKEPAFADSATGDSQASQLGMDSSLVGTTPKDIQAELLDGGVFRVQDHLGKTIVLDFWASWCGPCVQELPGTIETAAGYSRDKVLLVAVNQQENARTIREFLQARGWELSVALDPSGGIGQRFHVEAIPQTVIIGPSGKIERILVGANPDARAELKRTLQQLVAQEENSDVPDAE